MKHLPRRIGARNLYCCLAGGNREWPGGKFRASSSFRGRQEVARIAVAGGASHRAVASEHLGRYAQRLQNPRSMGCYRYQDFGTLDKQIDGVRRKLERVAKMAAKHGVLPCVHVHSGDTIPGSGTIAYMLLAGFDPSELGAYVDPMHMTIEGGNDGWRQGLDLLAPWIAISSLKNCKWITTGRDSHGQQRWTTRKCPLADGVCPLPRYFATLERLGSRGLYTLHSEYSDRNSWKVLNAEECLEQTRIDLEYVKKIV